MTDIDQTDIDTDPTENLPNLDCLSGDELRAFWLGTSSSRPIRAARRIFPSRRRGYVRTTKDLSHYAINKATAQGLRLKGEITRAMVYEAICDRIYSRLPEWARW